MNVLVTGGAGYVGSHCVRRLCQQGHTVVVYDNLCEGNRAAVDPAAALVEGDLLDRDRLARTFQRYAFDGVMHFASLLNVNESLAEACRYYENNVIGALHLVAEMIAHRVGRLVFSSSCAVYGVPPAVPIVEDMPKNPITPYGRTKWIVETALADCAAAHGFGAVSLRYFNASGAAPGGRLGEARRQEYHLIPLVLQVALGQRERIRVFGTDYPTPDGSAVRDYVHVDDLAEAHLLALERAEAGRAKACNVGTGCGASVRQVIEAARRVTGHAIPSEDAARREGDPPALFADPSRAAAELGWKPVHTELDPIVATAWEWHKRHPHGYE